MLLTNMFLTIYECNSFLWEWIIKREAITIYRSMSENLFERLKVSYPCKSYAMNDGKVGRGLEDQNLRKIRGVGKGGNDRITYLKKLRSNVAICIGWDWMYSIFVPYDIYRFIKNITR